MRVQEKINTEQFDSGLIFAKALVLLNSQDIKVEHILSYELARSFDEIMRKLRIAKSKLQVEQSARATGQPNSDIVIDCCAILLVVHWPSKGSVQDLVMSQIF